MQSDYYSLLVSGQPGHWKSGHGTTPVDRYLLCTVEAIQAPFMPLDDLAIERIRAMPALFACETNLAIPTPARVGYITRVQHRRDTYYLHFEFDEEVPPIDQARLIQLADELDLEKTSRGEVSELGTTHWAIKHVDLYEVLRRHALHRSTMTTTSLTGAVSRLKATEPPHPDVLAGPVTQAKSATVATTPALSAKPRVFIVHGHDIATREQVARFVQTLEFEPVILHEQANEGRTILAKFQDEATSAAFAVILMTGDDRGGVAADSVDQYQPRARQNVVFEFGFFAGHLGLKRVCALMDSQVDKPSDIDGLVYVSLKSEWKLQLAKEMKAAGLPVDLNRLST